jgi:trimethylamine--corrinoid protein Co-methyltransferase
VDLSENGQALDAIREVGPGKHFLGCAHTLANFETAFYRSQKPRRPIVPGRDW